MQIKTIAAVTINNNVVTAAVGVDWSQAVVGGYFSLDPGPTLSAPVYEIGTIRAPGDPANTSPGGAQWQIVLTGNYLAATNAAIATIIHKDFYPNGTPIWNAGDRNFYAIQNRANSVLDALVGQVSGGTLLPNNLRASPSDSNLQIWNPDQSLWFTVRIKGAVGAETLEIATPGVA